MEEKKQEISAGEGTVIASALKAGKSEVIIRHGDALPLKEPEQVVLEGCIDTPLRWLQKRVENINQKNTHIQVDRTNMKMLLVINEDSAYQTQITGALSISDEMKELGINSGEYISNFDMADLLKRNRSYFVSKIDAMKIVTELRNFKAKVEKEYELSDDKRGNAKALRSQIVDSNLPDKFSVNIPIFKSMEKHELLIEVEVNPNDLSCTLTSPDAHDFVKEQRDKIFDDQIKDIEGAAPELVIVEV
nr:hypothetical protein [uncultured Prevotella sp.]